MIQPTLFDSTPAPHGAFRKHGPATSREAGLAMTGPRLSELQERVLRAFQLNGPMTDCQLEHYLSSFEAGPSTYRKRRGELVAKGLLCDTGKRERNGAGRNMIVWAVQK